MVKYCNQINYRGEVENKLRVLRRTLIILQHLRKSPCNSQAGIIQGLTPPVIPAFIEKAAMITHA